MKRANNLVAKIADPDNLRLAFYNARKGKLYSKQVLIYQRALHLNLLHLRDEILTGKVNVGEYHSFKIFDPKERLISAPAFSEQVLHHAVINVCHQYFERHQIHDSYACRIGKGTYAALDRAKKYTRRFPWFLKLDIRQYFAGIHHEVLKQQLRRLFKDPTLLTILDAIIESYSDSPQRGLPIGNLTSQYFANHYLSGLGSFHQRKTAGQSLCPVYGR